jgi:hypothetical protein
MADLMTIMSTKEIAAEVARIFEALEDANALARARRIALKDYSEEMLRRMKADGVVAAKAPGRRGDVVMVIGESRKIHCREENHDRMIEWLKANGRWIALDDHARDDIEFNRSMDEFRAAMRRGEVADRPDFIGDERIRFLSCNGKNLSYTKKNGGDAHE